MDNADCPFCLYSGPSPILWQEDDVFVIEPLNPVVEGHALVIPTRHVEDFAHIPHVSGRVMEVAADFVEGWGDCNLITSKGTAATQTVKHLHLHIIPRTPGDGLLLPWSVA